MMYETVKRAVNIPVLHIADATAFRIKERNIHTIGLLGTIFTMEMDFYKGRLINKFNLNVVVPEKKDRMFINQIIYEELVLGKIEQESRNEYIRIMENLVERGAEGIILGCTEISLLVDENDSSVPVFDTTYIHAETAVEIALGEKSL